MKRTITAMLLCLVLTAGMTLPAFAAGESETAASAYLVEKGILEGDTSGNLMLDKSLTRAELAVILTRLDYIDSPGGLDDWRNWGAEYFANPETRINTFTDLPEWTVPYVEYCYQRSLMIGVGENRFAPGTAVSPKMACTVILRYCGIPETDWNYNTSVEKAASIGITPDTGLDGDIILRGAMAVVIYNGMHYEQGSEPVQPTQPTASPTETDVKQTVPAMTIDEMKAEIIRLTNEERAKAGLPALEVLPALMDCAQAKAQDFLDNHYFGHISPRYGTPGEMIKAAIPQAKSAGENIAPWTKTTHDVFTTLLDSPEHMKNLLSEKYTHIGIGIIEGADGGYWWVQQFVAL